MSELLPEGLSDKDKLELLEELLSWANREGVFKDASVLDVFHDLRDAIADQKRREAGE